MSECWKCDEPLDRDVNYCDQCAAPQKPRTAARSFNQSANDFSRGLDGLLDLIDGCPEMLAEGLADWDGYDDISETEWVRRFDDSFQWLRAYFYRLLLRHYDVSKSDLEEWLEEHEEELEESEGEPETLPTSTNENCACGTSLPSNAPSIITRWKGATEVRAVCYECFGQISSRIDVAE